MRRKLPGFALIATVLDTGDTDSGSAWVKLFYAAPNPIVAGSQVTLFWEVAAAPKVRIVAENYDSGVLVNDPAGGYLTLPSGPTASKTYTLSALDDNNQPIVQNGSIVSSSLTITVY